MKKIITLLLVLTGMVTTASAQLYVTGLNGVWGPESPAEMTAVGDGSYYITLDLVGEQGFALSTAKGDWGTFNYYRISPSGSDQAITLGTEVSLPDAGSGNDKAYTFFAENGSYTITANPTAKTMTVTLNSLNKMYVIGGIKDSDWTGTRGIEMKYQGNSIYTATITTEAANSYLSFSGKLVSTDNIDALAPYRFGADNQALALRGETAVTRNTNSPYITTAGTYRVTFNLKTLKVFINDYLDYYLMTSADGLSNWTLDGKLTDDGLNYSKSITGAGKYFVIVPDAAIVSEAFNNNWNMVIRPNANSEKWEIDFAKYNDVTKTNVSGSADDPRWWINTTNPGTIAFTFTPYTTKFNIDCSYEREVTSASDGFATFSMPNAVAVVAPAGGAVKYASAIASGKITWTPVEGEIPASTGVLLEGAGTYTFTPATGTPNAIEGNKLVAISNTMQLDQVIDSKTNYVLSSNSGKVGFYMVNAEGSWVNGNTAYLAVTAAEANNARAFFFSDEDAAAVDAVKATAVVNGEYFNISGQRVAQPTKGLYIVNGKKVIIK